MEVKLVEYLEFPLGRLSAGGIVIVTLSGVESDVFLVDDSNLHKLGRGDLSQLQGVGGHYKQSPVRLQVPSSGAWTAVVVPIGGRVEASVSVYPAVA
jgi:Domain of unknown function (DUF1883)